ncbi:MAG: peptidoglycan DD-metalloendopeptidase family protein, partial [Chloroflexota bacterium]
MADSRQKRAIISCLLLAALSGLLLSAAPWGLWTTASGHTPAFSSGAGSQQILISDSLFLYASSVLDFDIQAFLETQPGPLAGHVEEIDGEPWTAAESIQYNAMMFGLNPQLILTLLEAQAQVIGDANASVPLVSNGPERSQAEETFHNYVRQLAQQALLAYDNHRHGVVDSQLVFPDGEALTVPDSLNAGTYAVGASLSGSISHPQWQTWVGGSDPLFVEQFGRWFGDPLEDPDRRANAATLALSGYILPFPIGQTWYYTGGPHYYGGGTPGCTYGSGCPRPWSSLDVAQPEMIACPDGSYPAHRWLVAAKSGDVIQSSQALIVIDHRDGWRTYYSHVSSADKRGMGPIDRGDQLGHPSCEVEPGGFTTGVHVHFALYQVGVGFVDLNGRSFSGWTVGEASHYNGTMRLGDAMRQASIGRLAGTNDILNTGVNGSCPISGGVLLYKHANFDCDGGAASSGYFIRSDTGFSDLPSSFDNLASSIRIPPGWSVRLYDLPGRAGASVCRNSDDLSFAGDYFDGNVIPLNDRVSSFEVFDDVDCSGPFTGGAWSMTYFGDTELNTPCTATDVLDSTYVFRDWGNESPAGSCPADNWSVRFTRYVYLHAGTYDFGLASDDWARLKVNGETVVDNWQGAGERYGTRTFTAGAHEITVEYADILSDSYLSAWWWGPGYDMPRDSRAPGQWYARYWGNRSLQGDAIIFVNEDSGSLNHSWATEGPGFGLPADGFSGRFERQVPLICGTYRFQLSTDDGVRYWVNDQLLLDAWFDQVSDHEVVVDLESGNQQLKVEHYENGGLATISLDWSHESFCPG